MRAAYLLLLFAFVSPLRAQTTASLDGVVSSGGTPLPGVVVTVTSPALQGERATVTGSGGAYLFAALPPGEYSVRFDYTGARTVTKRATLQLSQRTRVDAQLALTSAETIEVVADNPPPIDAPQSATTLTLETVERLPHQRNQLATAQLAPGVNGNTLSNGQLQISGGPGYDNLVLVDGVVVTENRRSQMRPMYVEDAIVETTILTGAVTAEYGRFTGGVVNTITKTGGDEYSGSIRDSLSNPSWSAVSPANEEREDHLNHVFEGTLGGAILRERLWFFTAARWAKNDTARQTVSIPGTSSGVSYNESNDQKRYEAKLTARLTESHNFMASAFAIDTQTENSRFANNIYDLASLTARDEPESLLALRYDGQLMPNALVEVQLSRRTMSLSSGATTRDLIGGTVLQDRANSNARFGSPSLCAVCEEEQRDNDDVLVKVHYLIGNHNLVAGIDRFRERHFLEDHQSGSGFSLFVTRTALQNGAIYPVITPTTQNGGGSFIRWMPILSPAHENNLISESAFTNDQWRIGNRWTLSLGARYDRNHARDSDGNVSADDERVSPRLAVRYDLRGDGAHALTASYAEYASRVSNNIASAAQSAGAAAAIDFAYRGPAINNNALTVPLEDALRMIIDYFNTTQGGTANRNANNLRPNGSRDIPGYAAYFDGTLSTPYVRELTLGYSARLFTSGFARVDLISRDWRDFYAASVTPDTRHVTTPLGIPVDVALIRNSSNIERTYRAALLQARWDRPLYSAGVHYTWSKLRGNDEGETANGPVANFDPALYYAEFLDYERNSPIGYLQGDQRHRMRAWLDLELGDFDVSLLQTYDSGLAYSVTAGISTRWTGAPSSAAYASVPNGRYFISDRGALRTEDVHSTNLALRYRRGLAFVQADILNVFNFDAIADPQRLGSGVLTAANGTGLETFNPFTTTPVEGTHYRFAANFGQPLNNLAYQTPRTYRISIGMKF